MKKSKPRMPTAAEAEDFMKLVVANIKQLPIVGADDGMRRYEQLHVAAGLVAAGFDDFDPILVLKDHDKCAALDYLEVFRPEHPLSVKWSAMKQAGVVPARRGQGRGSKAGRDFVAVMLVDFLKTTGIKPTRSKNSVNVQSGCDIVANALQRSGQAWATPDAIRNAWEKRTR